MRKMAILICVNFGLLAGAGFDARAQTSFYWTNNAAGSSWSNSPATGYWTNNLGDGSIPNAGGSDDYVITFKNTGAITSTNNLGDGGGTNGTFTLNQLSFASGAAAVSLYGASLTFQTNSSGSLPLIAHANGTDTKLYNNLMLTTDLNVNVTGYRLWPYGVIGGQGTIVISNATNGWVFMAGTVTNTFMGNWVVNAGLLDIDAGNGNPALADVQLGFTSNSIVLNGGGLRPGYGFTLSSNRTLTIGINGGFIYPSGSPITLATTNQLLGNGALSVGCSGGSAGNGMTINAPQTSFGGTVSVNNGAGLTLGAVNSITNTITVTNGTLTVNIANAVAGGGVIVQPGSQIFLGAAAGTNAVYTVNDLSAIGGTDAMILALTNGANLSLSNGAMIVHSTAGGLAKPVNLPAGDNYVYGLGVNMPNSNFIIGDASGTGWRGVGVARTAYTLGSMTNSLTLIGNAEMDAQIGSTLTINSLITGGSAANTLAVRGPGTVSLVNNTNNFSSLITCAGGTTLKAGNASGNMTFNFADGLNTFAGINNGSTGQMVLSGSANSTNLVTGNFSGQNAAGTVVINGGTYLIYGGARNFAGNLIVSNGNFIVSPGSDRFGPVTGTGFVNIVAGSLIVTNTGYGWRIGCDSGTGLGNVSYSVNQSGGYVNINSGGGIQLGGTTTGTTNIYNFSGGSINSAGISLNSVGSALTQFAMNGGSLTNTAANIAVSGGASFLMNGGYLGSTGLVVNNASAAFVQTGGVVVIGGQIANYVAGSVAGLLNINGGTFTHTYSGGNPNVRGSSLIASNNAVVNFSGTAGEVRVGSDGSSGSWNIYNNASVNVGYGLQLNSMGINSAATGTVTLSGGKLTVGAGGIYGSIVTNPTMAIFNFNGGTLGATTNFAITAYSNAYFNVMAGGAVIDSSNFVITCNPRLINGTGGVDGGLIKNGTNTLVLVTNNTYTGTTMINAGRLLLAANAAINSSTSIVVMSGAALVVTNRGDKTFTVGTTQTLAGSGTIIGSVTNIGNVSPGFGGSGLLSCSSNFAQTALGTLSIKLSNGVNGVDYDELVVSNNVTLNGTLSIALMPGYSPSTSDVFVILSAKNISGNFAATNPPAMPAGLGVQILYTDTATLLSITGAPPPSASGYDLWAAAITNGQTAYNQSATGDGYPNLLKYATRSSPTNSDSLAAMSGTRTGGLLALQFYHDLSATDVTLFVEGADSTTNDATWLGIATNISGSWGGALNVIENTNTTPATVSVSDTEATATNRFLRLRVTRP